MTQFESWEFITSIKYPALFCLLACCQFCLCSAMYFSLCENMMCGVRAPWLVGHNNCKEGVQNNFAKGQLTLRLNQKVALEHATKTTANEQLAHTFWTCVRGNNSPYQPVAVVCICHLKRETGIARTVVIQTTNKAALVYHFVHLTS